MSAIRYTGTCARSHHVCANRQYILCDCLEKDFTTDELIRTCSECSCFVSLCCQHRWEIKPKPCHGYRLVFTDGACLSNGQAYATSGVGIALGMQAELQKSKTVDDTVDPGATRSSQRAELLAALLGLRALRTLKEAGEVYPLGGHRKRRDPHVDTSSNWIIATDSKYVGDGMTDWLPTKWKLNGMRTSDERTPANLDLFLELDRESAAAEAKHDIYVGFWYIPRKYNAIADRLAKDAAKRAPAVLPARILIPAVVVAPPK